MHRTIRNRISDTTGFARRAPHPFAGSLLKYPGHVPGERCAAAEGGTPPRRMAARGGRILAAGDFPEARNPSYTGTGDVGPFGVPRAPAAILPWYTKEDLVGRS